MTEKGQATTRKERREKDDVKTGDEVVWMDTDESILVKTRTTRMRGGCSSPRAGSHAKASWGGSEAMY